MSAKVVGLSGITIPRARKIVANYQVCSGPAVIAACRLLFAAGTAGDVQSVLDLQKKGIVAGFEARRAASAVRGKGLA